MSNFHSPPLPEQQRIVAILDEAFEGIGDAVTNAEKNLANARELFESYLKSVFDHRADGATFGGTDQTEINAATFIEAKINWKDDGPSSDAKDTPSDATKTGGRAATTRHIPGKLSLSVGMPKTLAKNGWNWSALIRLARLETGHTPSRRHPEYWGGEIPWIGIKDAKQAHGEEISKTAENTNALGIQNSSARILPTGTVCLSRTASVGYVIVLARPMATSQDFVNWVCTDAIEPHFLMYLFLAQGSELLKFSSGAVHQTIYFPEVKAFHICRPDIDEQKRIVAQANSLNVAVDNLEAIYQKKLDALAELKQSILQKAFCGGLAQSTPELSSIASSTIKTDTTTLAFAANVIALAYYRHAANQRGKTFGRVKAQKTMHLVESIGDIDLGRKPMRDAAGPNDFQHMLKAEDWAKSEQFFKFVSRDNGYDFKKLARFDEMIVGARVITKPYSKVLDKIDDLILLMNSQEAEIFATVHAAWNNLILDGAHIDDEAIILAARDDWHPDKKKIPKDKFRKAIRFIRDKKIVPDGSAKRVGGQEKLF